MATLTSKTITRALQMALDDMAPGRLRAGPIREDQNLLDVVDSLGFAELILALESALGIELPLDRVDLAEIVHVENLTTFIADTSGSERRSTPAQSRVL